MSYPVGHIPRANDGIEGLLEQIALSLNIAARTGQNPQAILAAIATAAANAVTGGFGVTFASQAEAEAGINTAHSMNPLRTKQAISAQSGGGGTSGVQTFAAANRATTVPSFIGVLGYETDTGFLYEAHSTTAGDWQALKMAASDGTSSMDANARVLKGPGGETAVDWSYGYLRLGNDDVEFFPSAPGFITLQGANSTLKFSGDGSLLTGVPTVGALSAYVGSLDTTFGFAINEATGRWTTSTSDHATGLESADGFVTKSPDGTSFRITVNNDGSLTTTAI